MENVEIKELIKYNKMKKFEISNRMDSAEGEEYDALRQEYIERSERIKLYEEELDK